MGVSKHRSIECYGCSPHRLLLSRIRAIEFFEAEWNSLCQILDPFITYLTVFCVRLCNPARLWVHCVDV